MTTKSPYWADRLFRLPDTWKTPSPQYPLGKFDAWFENLFFAAFGLVFLVALIALLAWLCLCSYQLIGEVRT